MRGLRAYLLPACAVAVLALLAAAPAVASEHKGHPISEVFVGILDHDTGVFGTNKEKGPDVNIEWRFDAPRFGFWERILSPRPTLGLNINTQGNTNSLYGALTWTFNITERIFFDWSMGGTVHDGKLSIQSLNRKELGSRVLFYLAAGIGYRLWGPHSISLRLDHMSNAKLAGDNSGLDTVGLRYSYRF